MSRSSLSTRTKIQASIVVALALLSLGVTIPARSGMVITIDVDAADSFTPGQALAIDVTKGGTDPAIVTVTSEPAGAVSYQGVIPPGTTTIAAATALGTASGPVIVHVSTNEGGEDDDTTLAVDTSEGPDHHEDPE